MGVYIKGMDMPMSCTVCPFENFGDCYGGKVKAIMDIDDYVSAGKRHPRCPLVPAPQEPTAEWVPSTKYKGFLTCSACEDCYIEGWSDKERKWRYCPQCGKRMGRFRK